MEQVTITLDKQQLYRIYDKSKREYLRIVRKDRSETTTDQVERMHENYEVVRSIEKQVPFIKEIWMSINHAKLSGDSIKESNLIKSLVNWYYAKS